MLGPLACWSAIIIFLGIQSLTSGNSTSDLPKWAGNITYTFAIVFIAIYFPLSAAICGFSAAYFLRNEFAGLANYERINIGCWTRFMFMVPFCLHPTFLCCFAFFVIPLHLWFFDIALYKGGEFWISNRPKQWLGEYEKPPESQE